MSSIERVRIMVLGDSGVGKTSFVHLAAHNEPIKSPSWTIGCSVEVKLHEFKEGTRDQKTFFVEFWDVGGSKNHRNARPVFYNPCHGVILVHDLTNRKSEKNLLKWLRELIHHIDSEGGASSPNSTTGEEDMDAENLMGMNSLIPILVVGTKADEKRSSVSSNNVGSKYNAEEILLDCRQARHLAAGSTNAVKLSRFFDRVIENRQRDTGRSYLDRFRNSSTSLSVLSPKFYLSHQD